MIRELTAEDADADAKRPGAALFVCCRRDDVRAEGAEIASSGAPLTVDVLDAQRVWRTRVTSIDKPTALDCSPDEYLSTLARALGGADDASTSTRFHFRWSRAAHTLTLVETMASGFAVKYAALTFVELEDESYWSELLHSAVTERARMMDELSRQKRRIDELEAVVRDKDALLEQALDGKQHVEDALLDGFCAVLNAKKDEIQRLRSEVEAASTRGVQKQTSMARKTQATRTIATGAGVKRTRMPRGAKLKREEKEKEKEASDHDASSDEGESSRDGSRDASHGDAESDDDGAAGRKRARRRATDAYSQLPSSLQIDSQRVRSPDDIIADVDIMKRDAGVEEETEEAKKKEEREEEKEEEVPKRTATLAVDSEEEDILDILG